MSRSSAADRLPEREVTRPLQESLASPVSGPGERLLGLLCSPSLLADRAPEPHACPACEESFSLSPRVNFPFQLE